MFSRRSKLELYMEILEQIRCGSNTPTRIIYKTNLSWKTCNEYLSGLEQQELIKKSNGIDKDKRVKNSYAITEKGENFLHYFSNAIVLINSDDDRDKHNWRQSFSLDPVSHEGYS